MCCSSIFIEWTRGASFIIPKSNISPTPNPVTHKNLHKWQITNRCICVKFIGQINCTIETLMNTIQPVLGISQNNMNVLQYWGRTKPTQLTKKSSYSVLNFRKFTPNSFKNYVIFSLPPTPPPVSKNQIFRYPPLPPNQQKSGFGLLPPPPLVDDVILEWPLIDFNLLSKLFQIPY